MDKDRSLQNALKDNSSAYENRGIESNQKTAGPIQKKSQSPKEDIVDKLLRGFLAFFLAVFISAVIAGMLEAVQGWEIVFGSLPMIAITALLYYPSYKVLTLMGFFRKK